MRQLKLSWQSRSTQQNWNSSICKAAVPSVCLHRTFRQTFQTCIKKPRLLQVRGFFFTTYLWRRMRDSNPRYGYKPYASLAGKCLRPLGQFSTLFALLRCAATEDKIIDGQIYFFKQTTRIFLIFLKIFSLPDISLLIF